MKITDITRYILFFLLFCTVPQSQLMAQDMLLAEHPDYDADEPFIHRVLLIGDSMTGRIGRRLQAYGDVNGFDVATVYQDGATIQKWADTNRLKQVIDQYDPDVVFISLGMNNLFEKNPERNLNDDVDDILTTIGDRYYVWIGPPCWPGRDGGEILVDWLREKNGDGNFFDSFDLKIERESSRNIHPTQKGSIDWMEKFLDWVWEDTTLNFKSLDYPDSNATSKNSSIFVYKRQKETL